MRASLFVLALLFGFCAQRLTAAETNSLDPHLEGLRPLLGKTFRGEFAASQPGKPLVDISKWERALNGKAVRALHSLNDGAYGGETIYVWDPEEKVVKFFYFTTASFRTTGTVQFNGNTFRTHEKVLGNAGGIREVRATAEIKPDGSFAVKVEHLTGDRWAQVRETTYKPDPNAEVRFK